jgi:large subunit ribosomal protein L31e
MAKEFKEKTITINLRKVFDKPVTKRAKSSLFVVKQAVKKETRAENIKLSNLVNETLWEKGLFKAQRKITVKVVSEKDGVRVYLPTEKPLVKETKKSEKTEKKELSKEEKPKDKKETSNETKKEQPKQKVEEKTESSNKETEKKTEKK